MTYVPSRSAWPIPANADGFEWQRAKGVDGKGSDLALQKRPGVAWGGFDPLQTNGLFLSFARVELTPEATLEFANRYGRLYIPEKFDDQHDIFGREPERFSRWCEEIIAMRECVEMWEALKADPDGEVISERIQNYGGRWDYTSPYRAAPREGIGGVGWLTTVADAAREWVCHRVNEALWKSACPQVHWNPKTGGYVSTVRYRSLVGAMYWQLAQALEFGKRFKPCAECGLPFEVAGDRDRGSKRTDRETCSDKCRTRRSRKKKELTQQLATKGKTPAQIAAEVGSDVSTIKRWLKGQKGK